MAHSVEMDRPIWYQYWRCTDQLVFHFNLGRWILRTVRAWTRWSVMRHRECVVGVRGCDGVDVEINCDPRGLSALGPVRSIMDRASMTFVLIGISGCRGGSSRTSSVPSGGSRRSRGMLTSSIHRPVRGGPVQWAYHMGRCLPWITWAILFAALYVRGLRKSLVDTMNKLYGRTARAKGAPEQVVLRSHIVRNALLTIVTMLGMDIGLALGAPCLAETCTLCRARQHRRQGAVELRHADGAGHHRLRHRRDHRLQPHRRPALCLHRPTHPFDLAA